MKKTLALSKNLCYNITYAEKMPVWWNWQTRWTQNPVVVIPYRFDPDHRHQKKASILIQDWCFFQRNTLFACEIMLSHCEILLAQCEIRLRRVRNRSKNKLWWAGRVLAVPDCYRQILLSTHETKSTLPPTAERGTVTPRALKPHLREKFWRGLGRVFA